jgi:hypothetical protein
MACLNYFQLWMQNVEVCCLLFHSESFDKVWSKIREAELTSDINSSAEGRKRKRRAKLVVRNLWISITLGLDYRAVDLYSLRYFIKHL